MTAAEQIVVNLESLRALVVDDAPELRLLLEPLLAAEGFDVRTACDGLTAVETARSFDPHVIVLDLVMPGIDGLEACRQLRTFSDAYVVMLTSKDDEVDRIVGLSVGADDYLAKPFSPRELVARVRAMLRRPRRTGATAEDQARHIGELMIDPVSRTVSVEQEPVELTRIEFDLLEVLSRRPKMVFSRVQLLEAVWGPNWYGDTHVVDVHISNLRRKLADGSPARRYVHTVRGIGFRLDAE